MINSQAKGKRFEQWVVSWLKGLGFASARRSGPGFDGEDILGVSGLYIECKHCESWHLFAWIAKAKARCKGQPWIIVAKRNRDDPVMIMDLKLGQELLEKIKEVS